MSSTPIPGASTRAERSPGEDLAFSDRWGESTERSRARRAVAAVKRRRLFRSRGAVLSAIAVVAVSGVGAAGAGAHNVGGSTGGGSAGGNVALEQIALCESGGDPTAVSPDGLYRGKYQFSRETWTAIGGTGDPAAAPESVQDQMAAQLYAQAGTSPWPNCG